MRDENFTLGGLSAIAVLLIAAFAIDRIVNAILFLLSFWNTWDERFPDPAEVAEGKDRVRAQRNQKLIYYVLAGICSSAVIVALDFNGILYHIGFKSHWIDVFLTVLILMGGAERLAELLKTPGAPGVASASEDKPLEVRGTLQLVDTPAKEAATGALPRSV